MIEVIPAITSSQAKTGSDAETSEGKVELLAAAADFFADRLLTCKQQKRLSFFIEFTAQPVRGPISLDMLAGKSGLFGFRPPRLFEMTVSSAAGMRAALDAVAVEMVHIAQIMSQRLEIFAKKRKIDGQRETALKARWLGKRAVFIDALPRIERAWVIEAEVTSKQLVGEFLSWSSGRIRSVPRQRPKGDKIGLYRVRPTKIAMPASSQIWSDKEEETVMVPSISGAESLRSEPAQTPAFPQNFSPDIVPADFAAVDAAGASGRNLSNDSANDSAIGSAQQGDGRQAKARQMVPAPAAQKIVAAAPIEPPQMAEFAIYVEVPSLGTTRRLNSGAFQGKLNDLLERGLIARESVRAAMRLADERRRQLR
ncbi:hypothetical protein N9K58_07220 [Alphaproteobacteria bacterium]|nr:hypothetical protein [Alphaproteobacteria bacterium]